MNIRGFDAYIIRAIGPVYTPCELTDYLRSRVAFVLLSQNTRGAICARSLTSKLADSLLWDYTPCEPTDFFGHALRFVLLSQNARGAICARSLTSKLADSLRLIIIRSKNGISSRLCRVYHPSQRLGISSAHKAVYHPLVERHIINTKCCILSKPKAWYILLIRQPTAATFSHRRRLFLQTNNGLICSPRSIARYDS